MYASIAGTESIRKDIDSTKIDGRSKAILIDW